MSAVSPDRLRIAVIGTGISGLAAAWLLSRSHEVTVYERSERLGGHSNTVDAVTAEGVTPVDTGFIVYNEQTYPNLTALFDLLDVPTEDSEMSFAVSLGGGSLEYSGSNVATVFAQKRNMLRPRFWSMLRDLRRFYNEAPAQVTRLEAIGTTLGDYLKSEKFGSAFREDHLLPMAAAIWSAPAKAMLDYPAASFIRFHDNHGLLKLKDRPTWRTVTGGSRNYISRLVRDFAGHVRLNSAVVSIRRDPNGVDLRDGDGDVRRYDHVIVATHADQALAMLSDATATERTILSSFRYSRNLAVLHSDESLMPKRGVVELELHRRPQDHRQYWRYRHLLDEPSAKYPVGDAVVRDAQPHADASRRHHSSQRDLPASFIRLRGHGRTTQALVAAGPPSHMVRRLLFRFGLS